jgi:ribosome-associated heat shock protein Hsp15
MSDASLRLDKWLWHARFFKSRSLAAKVCQSKKIRVNGDLISKAHQKVRPGDVLTFPLGPHIRQIEISALGTRRGPAAEAQTLYKDLDPPSAKQKPKEQPVPPPAQRDTGSGRPTKSQRRAIDRLKDFLFGR